MSLIDHITELRKRLLWSFLYIVIVFIICFYFADQLFAFLAAPLVNLMDIENGQGFIYTALQEAFFTELKIAFFFALFFSVPRAGTTEEKKCKRSASLFFFQSSRGGD